MDGAGVARLRTGKAGKLGENILPCRKVGVFARWGKGGPDGSIDLEKAGVLREVMYAFAKGPFGLKRARRNGGIRPDYRKYPMWGRSPTTHKLSSTRERGKEKNQLESGTRKGGTRKGSLPLSGKFLPRKGFM